MNKYTQNIVDNLNVGITNQLDLLSLLEELTQNHLINLYKARELEGEVYKSIEVLREIKGRLLDN